MTKLMTNVNARQRILAYLQSHPGVSAAEIARALRVTPADIRHHLAILVSDGRARGVGERRDRGRGRPVRIYGPGQVATGDALPGLADTVLSLLLEGLTPGERDSVLQSLAGALVPFSETEPTGPVSRRLSLVIERLNPLHYQPRWEAHAQGPRVIFERCPYAAILEKHPELCRMDAFLLRRFLGADVEQIAKLEQNARGLPFCMFVV